MTSFLVFVVSCISRITLSCFSWICYRHPFFRQMQNTYERCYRQKSKHDTVDYEIKPLPVHREGKEIANQGDTGKVPCRSNCYTLAGQCATPPYRSNQHSYPRQECANVPWEHTGRNRENYTYQYHCRSFHTDTFTHTKEKHDKRGNSHDYHIYYMLN